MKHSYYALKKCYFAIPILFLLSGTAFIPSEKPLTFPLLIAPGDVCNSLAANAIGGTVWEDWNYDGIMNENPLLGVAGVNVQLTDQAGNQQTLTTDSDGNFLFSNLTAAQYRLEFTIPTVLNWAQPTPQGADNGTAVQRVQPGNCANFGIGSANEYTIPNPTMSTNCFVLGDNVNGTNQDGMVVVSFPYLSGSTDLRPVPTAQRSGTDPDPADGHNRFDDPLQHDVAVEALHVGTTWGLAWQKGGENLFMGSFMKRHTSYGPDGPGAIYYSQGTTTTVGSLLTTLPNGTNPHQTNENDIITTDYETGTAADPWVNTWDAVGKNGFGGMAISPDERTLFVVNLHDQKLYRIPVDDAPAITGTITSYTVPQPTGVTDFNDVRPFALKMYKGTLYLGLINSAESTAPANAPSSRINNMNSVGTDPTQLRAYIYTFDITTNTFSNTPLFEFPLDYPRGCVADANLTNCNGLNAEWRPWVREVTYVEKNNDAYPQPMFTDIEFTDGGNTLLLGLRDRFGDQMGFNCNDDPARPSALFNSAAAGDLLRACKVNGVWTLESDANCGTLTGSHPNNGNGPGSPGGEFFGNDEFNTGNPNHEEINLGGLAVLQVRNEVAAIVYDPLPSGSDGDAFLDSGLRYFDLDNGDFIRAYRVQYTHIRDDQGWFLPGPGQSSTLGKANGLGDLEVMSTAPPLAVGNFVWEDTNADGIQDVNEAGIAGLTIQLLQNNNVIATTTTDADGFYAFSADGALNQTWVNANDRVLHDTDYTIRIVNVTGNNQSASLNNYYLSPPNQGNNDSLDSDALNSGDHADITFRTASVGTTTSRQDAGFLPDPCPATPICQPVSFIRKFTN